MIHFDIDGVCRHLIGAIVEGGINQWDQPMPNGQGVCEYIDDHLDLLMTAPATRYCAAIKKLKNVHFISCQPSSWRPGTAYWIYKHFPNSQVTIDFVEKPEEKMEFLDYNDFLVEDYPKFEDYSKIILIDWPYNRHVEKPALRITEPWQLKNILGGRCNEQMG